MSDPPPPTRGLGARVPRLAWVALGLGLLLGAYAWLGFRWVPHLLRTQAVEFVRAEYGRELTLGAIQVHPFAFTLDVRGVALPDEDGEAMLAFERLFVDFEPSKSLFQWAYAFDRITLVRPSVHAVVREGGQLNLAALAGDAPADQGEDHDGALPSLRVQRLSVHNGEAVFTDHDRPRRFDQQIAPLSFTLRDFDTSGEDGRLKLSARLPEGAQVSWRGSVRMSPELHSAGDIAISHVSVVKLAEYLEGSLPCTVSKGWISLAGSYAVQAGEALQGNVDLDYIKLADLGLRRRGGTRDEVSVPDLRVVGVQANLETNHLKVDEVEILRPRARGVLEASGRVSLERLANGASGRKRPAAAAGDSDAGTPWAVELGRLTLQKGEIEFVDAALAPGTRLTLRPIQVTAEKLSLDLTRAVPVRFEAAIDGKSPIRAEGHIRPAPLSAEFDVDVEDIDLALGQPYIDLFTSIRLTKGQLSSHGRVSLGKVNAGGEELVFEGDLQLTNVQAFDNVQRRPLLGFRALRVEGIRHSVEPDSLRIKQIVLQRPYARIVITPQGELNVADALEPDPEARKPAAVNASERTEADEPALSLEDRILLAGAKMPVSIDTVQVRNMRLDFADTLVEPEFAADIRGLSGTARQLSTAARSRARLRLDGRLATGSPVHVRGTLRPFAFDKFSDINIEFENISLPIFNPYATNFAGYNISRGELRAALHYEVRDRGLQANHAIRIDRLQWGEKTATKQRATLPVRLATALLRDRKGVISLDLPVEGTLDDPEFRIGPIVWQVIKNVIVKAVAAPFDLLGKAFKGSEDARYISFSPGDATLDDAQRAALSSLAGALRERPTLRVDVPVGTIPSLDEKALRDAKFERLVRQAVQSESGASSSLASLPPAERLDALQAVYRQLTGSQPTLDETPVNREGLSHTEAREALAARQADALAKQTREKVPVDQSELSALGERRAEAIELAILEDTDLDPSRVLLSTESKIAEERGKVRFELAFE